MLFTMDKIVVKTASFWLIKLRKVVYKISVEKFKRLFNSTISSHVVLYLQEKEKREAHSEYRSTHKVMSVYFFR